MDCLGEDGGVEDRDPGRIRKEVVEEIPDNTPITFPEVIQAQLNRGKKAAAFPVSESEWLDMGQLSELEKMRERLYGR